MQYTHIFNNEKIIAGIHLCKTIEDCRHNPIHKNLKYYKVTVLQKLFYFLCSIYNLDSYINWFTNIFFSFFFFFIKKYPFFSKLLFYQIIFHCPTRISVFICNNGYSKNNQARQSRGTTIFTIIFSHSSCFGQSTANCRSRKGGILETQYQKLFQLALKTVLLTGPNKSFKM